jgi:hypothetical protein
MRHVPLSLCFPPFSPRLQCISRGQAQPRFPQPAQSLSLTAPPPPARGAHLHTVIRFLRSTTTLREDAFLEGSPRAMVMWTKLVSIQMCGHCCCRPMPLTRPGAPAPSPDHR